MVLVQAASKGARVAIAGRNIAKRFGHVQALIDATVTVQPTCNPLLR